MRNAQVILLALSLTFPGAVSPAVAVPTNPQPSAADALKAAVGLLDQGRFREAVQAFQRADDLVEGPCGPCLLGLSRAHLGLKQPEKAIDAARKAVEALRTPDMIGQAWNQVGVGLMSRPSPDLAGAAEAFRKAVEVGVDGQLANVSRYNLADVLWRQKRYAESERFAREALMADPEGPAAKNARIVLCQARTDGAPLLPPEELYEEASCPKEGLRTFDEEKIAAAKDATVSRPEKVFGGPPQYDDRARADGAEGVVILESIIDQEGCVLNLRVCKSLHPSLDLAALAAVRRWVFEPARLDGQPVKVYYTLSVNFQIGNRPGPG